MSWADVGEVVKAVAPGFPAGPDCFGAYIGYQGLTKWREKTIGKQRVELAAAMANHASTRTTQLYDRRRDQVSPGEVERIVIQSACQRVTQRFARASNSWPPGHLTADRGVTQRFV